MAISPLNPIDPSAVVTETRAQLDINPTACLLIDSHLGILYANSCAEALLGTQHEHSSFADFLEPHLGHTGTLESLQSACSHGVTWEADNVHLHLDGAHRLLVHLTFRPLATVRHMGILMLIATPKETRDRPDLADAMSDVFDVVCENDQGAVWTWEPQIDDFRQYGLAFDLPNPGEGQSISLFSIVDQIDSRDRDEFAETMANISRGGADSLEVCVRICALDANPRWVRLFGSTRRRDSEGRPTLITGAAFDVTNFKVTEAQLKHQEFNFNLALENARQGIWEWDAENGEFSASRTWCDLLGYDVADNATDFPNIQQLAHPSDFERSRLELIAVLKGEKSHYEIAQRLRHRDGHYLHCLVRGCVVDRDEHGRVTRMTGTHTDITELKNVEEALQDSKTKLDLALQSSRQGIWEWVPGEDAFTHYGYARPSDPNQQVTQGYDLFDLAHPDDRDKIKKALKDYLSGKTPQYALEYRERSADGTYRCYYVSGRAVDRDEHDRVTRMVGTYTDITDLRVQHQRLELALQNGRQGMWEWRPKSDEIQFSDSWYSLYGYADGAIHSVRDHVSNLIHPDDFELARKNLLALLRGERDEYSVEYRFRQENGNYLWVIERAAVVERDASGQATLLVGFHVDIDDRKRMENDLERSQRFLTLVLDTIPDMVYWKDTKSRYLGANRHYADAAGMKNVSDIVGRTDFELPWAEHAVTYRTIDKTVLKSGETHHSRQKFRDADGENHVVATSKAAILDGHGDPVGLLGISKQITKQQIYEKQLEKLAECITGDNSSRLLNALAKGATELSQIDNAFIATVDRDGDNATVISTYPDNRKLDGLCYRLENTPCMQAAANDVCVFEENVQMHFPLDDALKTFEVSSYVGKRLLDDGGRIIGIFVLYDSKRPHNAEHAVSVLNILAATAAREIQREQREIALRRSEDRFRTIYDDVPTMICTVDSTGKIVDANKAWEVATGFNANESVGTQLVNYFETDSVTFYRQLRADSDSERTETLSLERKDGGIIKVRVGSTTAISPDGFPVTIIVFDDITAQIDAEQQLRLAATAFETHEALVVRDETKHIVRVNTAFTTLTGYDSDDVIGKTEIGFAAYEERTVWSTVTACGKWDGERNLTCADGTEIAVWETITAVHDDRGAVTHYVENFTDISELKQALADAERLALYDPLTELPNRRYLSEQLEASISLSVRNKTKGALLFIDLDQFKKINDSLGHAIGDSLLIEVSRRLTGLLRREDTIARLGGDEFVIVLPNLGTETNYCIDQARRIADKIHDEIEKTYVVDDHSFNITPTIGVTLFPDDGKTVNDFLQEADSAMYKGKADGRNVTKFFHPSMQSEAQKRLGLERDLRNAVSRDELELYFQPQYSADGRLFAAEALLRWHHPERGTVPPGLFIPIAEDSGLILDIGDWVLTRATDCLKRWERDDCLFIDHLAVNISSRQFRASDFVHDVIRKLVAAGVSPKLVTLEVTEGTVIDNFEETARKMAELRDIGIGFSVDDFGVGYSSLSYLSRLPLDQLKIDRSFVTDVLDDPNDAVITETIIGMGSNLQLNTIAEGVETPQQLNFLLDNGCNGFQGYLFCKPVPEREFLALETQWDIEANK